MGDWRNRPSGVGEYRGRLNGTLKELVLLDGIWGEEVDLMVASGAVIGRGEADSESELMPEVLEESVLLDPPAPLNRLWESMWTGIGLRISADSEVLALGLA